MSEIMFCSEKGAMGKLILDGENLKFEGDVEESAQILFNHVCKMFNNSRFGAMPCKNDQSNKHIDLVKKWLANPDSVSQKERDENAEASLVAWVADLAANRAAYEAAYRAAGWGATEAARAAARAAEGDAARAAAEAARAVDWAAYKAAEGDVEGAKNWVETYEELVK